TIVVIIRAPFPDAAVHVVKSPHIWKFFFPRIGKNGVARFMLLSEKTIEPSVFRKFIYFIAEMVSSVRTSSACVFPFGFRRQAHNFVDADQLEIAQFERHLGAERDGVVPIDHFRGIESTPTSARMLASDGRVGGLHCLKLRDGE